ncbi:hypothetical protein [Thermococcus sp.]
MELNIGKVNVNFLGELDDGFTEAFKGLFARRYLPDVHEGSGEPEVSVERFKGDVFRVFGSAYDYIGRDEYKIESPVPAAYGNEAPIFFILQAAARAGAKRGKIFITDSVGVLQPNGKAVLFVGYPHTGKSTMSALAIAEELTVLSTENTVVEVRDGRLHIVAGTDVLVYDPLIEKIYDLSVPYDAQTRSGYRIADLRKDPIRRDALRKGVEIEKIVVLHAAFHCHGASFSPIRGRKVRKTLWYFATALMKGLDYYEPMPLHVPMNEEINGNIRIFLENASQNYLGNMYEAFGSHKRIFHEIVEL